jgi:hypothetical protein
MRLSLASLVLTLTLSLPKALAIPIKEPVDVPTTDLIATRPGAAYQACYVIYSSARVKRSLDLTEHEIEKRCGKLKTKRSALPNPNPEPNPDPLMVANPSNPGGGIDGGAPWDGGGGGGGGWPGDVGEGFLQCYTVYISDKRDVGTNEIEKRCGKEKRDAEDEVIKRDKPKYANYDRYVPVKE